MSMSSRLLQRGISLWKSGQKEEARKIFEAVLYNDNQNDTAWIWYIYSLETDREKIAALETFLNIFPDHEAGLSALAKLKTEAASREVGHAKALADLPKASETRQGVLRPASTPRQTVEAKYAAIPWALVIFGACLLLAGSTTFLGRYNSLQADYRALESREAFLYKNYEGLNQAYLALESEKAALSDTYNQLVSQYSLLHSEYTILTGNYETLYAEHTQLIDQYNILSGDYTWLENNAIKPPYIVVHDRVVDTTFYDTDGQLITWTTPFAGLEYGIENGANLRRRIVEDHWKTMLVYTEYDEPIWIRDFSDFVTPTTFNKVVPALYAKSTSAYDFIYRLWYMIGQLAHYADEDLETPRYSLETLLAGGGDCEDLSILMASLVQAAPVNWYVDLVYVDSDNINEPQSPDHVVVYIDTGQETFIVETTSNQVMLPYNNGVTGWLAGHLDSSTDQIYPVYLR